MRNTLLHVTPDVREDGLIVQLHVDRAHRHRAGDVATHTSRELGGCNFRNSAASVSELAEACR